MPLRAGTPHSSHEGQPRQDVTSTHEGSRRDRLEQFPQFGVDFLFATDRFGHLGAKNGAASLPQPVDSHFHSSLAEPEIRRHRSIRRQVGTVSQIREQRPGQIGFPGGIVFAAEPLIRRLPRVLVSL